MNTDPMIPGGARVVAMTSLMSAEKQLFSAQRDVQEAHDSMVDQGAYSAYARLAPGQLATAVDILTGVGLIQGIPADSTLGKASSDALKHAKAAQEQLGEGSLYSPTSSSEILASIAASRAAIATILPNEA